MHFSICRRPSLSLDGRWRSVEIEATELKPVQSRQAEAVIQSPRTHGRTPGRRRGDGQGARGSQRPGRHRDRVPARVVAQCGARLLLRPDSLHQAYGRLGARVAADSCAVRNHLRIATTAGYGSHFLHSTGQLHKGGPPGRDVPSDRPGGTPGCRHRSQAVRRFDPQAGLAMMRLPVRRIRRQDRRGGCRREALRWRSR